MALVGTALTFKVSGDRLVLRITRIAGLALASALAVASFQNAVPWGELDCIID